MDDWLSLSHRTALLIDGVRQIGKTTVIRSFAKSRYKNFVEINLLDDLKAKGTFSNTKNSDDLYYRLTIFSEKQK